MKIKINIEVELTRVLTSIIIRKEIELRMIEIMNQDMNQESDVDFLYVLNFELNNLET